MTLRKGIFYAVLSGILIVLSLPHFNLWPLSWIALVPLLIAIKKVDSKFSSQYSFSDGNKKTKFSSQYSFSDGNKKTKTAFILGFITGAIYFFGMTYWIIPLHPYAGSGNKFFNIFLTILGSVALAGYLALYIATFAWVMKKIRWRSGLLYIFSAAVFWTSLEWVRSWFFSGFPWGDIGYAQWKNLPFIQIASITGVYGVSFLLVMVNATIADLIGKWPKWRDGLKSAIIPACLVLLTFVYGFIVMSQELDQEKVKVVLVPGNIRQIDKWHRRNLPRIFVKYLETTAKAVDDSTELLIWPETAIPANLFSVSRVGYFKELERMLKGLDVDLFFGMPYYDDDGKYYNAAFLISSEGEVLDSYYKIHLVPFSESIPLKRFIPQSILDKILGFADFEGGKRITVFRLPRSGIPFASVICFESAFPDLFRKFVKNGALFMGVITNDAWFEGTGCAAQHYAMAPFRAVENRVPIFHCANGGISCTIDSYGREGKDKIIAFKGGRTFIEGELAIRNSTTIYTRYGDWFPIICSMLLMVLVFRSVYVHFKNRKRE